MCRPTLVLTLMIFLGGVCAAAAGTYGSGVQLTETTAISTILADPEPYVGRTVAVEGTVVEVCAKRGCWLELASDQKYQSIQIKVTDGVIVFPMNARGKTARVQGKVEELRLTKDQALAWAEHRAEEQSRPFDPASITGPVTKYRIRASGAEIR